MKKSYLLSLLLLSFLMGLSTTLLYAQSEREITLSDPGTLSTQIAESDYSTILSLTLKGDINQHDIRFIQKNLKEVTSLDLTDTKILRAERSLGSGTYYPEDNLFDYALQEMPKLQHIKLPKTLKVVGMKAFYSCPALTEIEIPEGVDFLRGYAFAFCKSLKKATVPGTVEKIENYVFLGCEALTEVNLGEGLTMLGGDMFHDCKSLASIKLPNTLKEIGHQSFKGCLLLSELTLPASCTKVGVQIFRDCKAIKTLTCLALEAPEAAQKSFYPEQYEQIELRIPQEAKLSYLDSPIWSMFQKMRNLEGKPLAIHSAEESMASPIARWQDGSLHLSNIAGIPITIYDAEGHLIIRDTPTSESVFYSLPRGLYIIKTPYNSLIAL